MDKCIPNFEGIESTHVEMWSKRSESSADDCGQRGEISKLMTRLLGHEGYPRQDDGATEWRKLLPVFFCTHPNAPKMDESNVDGPLGGRKR